MRPIALVGVMGCGKTSVGRVLSRLVNRGFVDLDHSIEASTGLSVAAIFHAEGEAGFRDRETRELRRVLHDPDAGVISLGGGAVLRPENRDLLGRLAQTIWLDVDVDVAWRRVAASRVERPLARDEPTYRELYRIRRPIYASVADAIVDSNRSAEETAGACAQGVVVRDGSIERIESSIGDRRAVLIADRNVAARAHGAFADRVEIDGGEQAKAPASLERLWRALAAADLERRDVLVAVGGGCVTDVAGFAAATFRRGIAWIACPTTLVGQVDAAIGGKTAINVAAKNDVGAFHLPESVLADPDLLLTLTPTDWAQGMAETIKTALIAGDGLYDLVRAWPAGSRGSAEERQDLVRRTAAVKVAIVARDPTERGIRAHLNLGHTVGHGIEAVAGYGRGPAGLAHGQAVSVGLAAALWLSTRALGLDPEVLRTVEELLRGQGLPIRAPGLDPEAVLAAMRGDKKRERGRTRFVLLAAPGRCERGVELSDDLVEAAVRRAVDHPSAIV